MIEAAITILQVRVVDLMEVSLLGLVLRRDQH